MTDLVWRAVRCCCQPTKLLGFLRLPDRPVALYKVKDRAGARHTVEVRPIGECTIELDIMNSEATRTRHERELAVYSEDRGVEFWRTIPDFVEVKEPA